MHQLVKHSRFALFVLVGLLCLSIFGQSDTTRATVLGFVLLTEEDAGELRLTEAEVVEGVRLEAETRGRHTGPHIVLETPEAIEGVVETTTPIELSLTFEPNLAPVADPVEEQSLRVVARKGIFRRNLTSLILEHAVLTPTGNGGWRIVIRNVEIPAGKFGIEVTIADRIGNTTNHRYFFRVSA